MLTLFIEEDARVLSRCRNVFWNISQELNYVSQVVLVSRVVLARVRLEQIVARSQFKSLNRKEKHEGNVSQKTPQKNAIPCRQYSIYRPGFHNQHLITPLGNGTASFECPL